MNIGAPIATIAIVDKDGKMQQNFRAWAQEVSAESTLSGNGNPEGVIEAVQSREYHDLTGSVGATKYIKHFDNISGNKKQGWRVIG